MDVKMRGRNPAVAEVYIPIPFVHPPITALGESDIKIDPSCLPIFSLHSPPLRQMRGTRDGLTLKMHVVHSRTK
jgi:hypothetical protein